MADDKPLLAFPKTPMHLLSQSLSVDARHHRAQLIRMFLSEIRNPWIEGKRDLWVHVFEEALDELGRALSEGMWLEGVRMMRNELRKRHQGEMDQSTRHLFLCVAPNYMDSLSIGCAFTAGTYLLHDAAAVLFGSTECSTAQMIGGTFTLKGTTPQEHGPLCRVLRMAVYVHLSLTLEQNFLLDSSIALVFPHPPRKKHFIRALLSYKTPSGFRSLNTPQTFHAGATLLSTSPGVDFRSQHAELHCGLGWGNIPVSGGGNADATLGSMEFARHQRIEVLELRCVPLPVPSAHAGSAEGQAVQWTTCGHMRYRSFQFYSFCSSPLDEEDSDAPFGSVILALVEERRESGKERCTVAGCGVPRAQHEVHYVHAGVRVAVSLSEEAEEAENSQGGGKVYMWVSCGRCGAKSTRREMSDGTFLLSFGKVIEMLVYAPVLGRASICSCASPASNPQLLLRRHFSVGPQNDNQDQSKDKHAVVVTFTCHKVDVYELRGPRLQVTRCVGAGDRMGEGSNEGYGYGGGVDERDWGSIIAFTLSAVEYRREMGCCGGRQAQELGAGFPSHHTDTDTEEGGIASRTSSDELGSVSISWKGHTDPDAAGAGLGLFSIREALRKGKGQRGVSPSSSQSPRPSSSPEFDSVRGSAVGGVSLLGEVEDIIPPLHLSPKDDNPLPQQEMSLDESTRSLGTVSSLAGTLTSGLSSAVRFLLKNGATGTTVSVPVDGASGTHSASPSLQHGLPWASPDGGTPVERINGGDDGRPHVQLDWTHGKRLKFSCTVYYAKQFARLRTMCGVSDEAFVESLQRSKEWGADGGKSRSDFWKTEDERFVIKTLVDAWNVADLQVLLDLAPSYFQYMYATATPKATVLTKMMGFYTIEIRNLETGNVQSKADLLVMENLFYQQTVTRTFDLKGIQGRKVKPSSSNGSQVAHKAKTLFDGEWIEAQQKTPMLVRPHSQQVLCSAIRSDADFLAKSNIMDYSLLVGVDEEHKQISCGLVDTIGSYTFAKTLEYKAKHGLKPDKEITVIPPAEYQERFVNALEGYFLACPDKWSKPMDESEIISDANLLPSVL